MRTEIIDTIITHQKELIENLKKSLSTYETTTDLDEESTIDLDDKSHQADIQDIKMKINDKLKMEQDDLQHINILKFRASDELQEGAIVETEEVFYFIGFTFAPIASKAKNILGVSLDAPVFQENEGKKKGDDLILGNTKQKILNIY